jgi:hypothetical protein
MVDLGPRAVRPKQVCGVGAPAPDADYGPLILP